MRIWRALKSLGCAALRDGAHLLPAGGEREQSLEKLAQECRREGGSAWLMKVQPRSPDEAGNYRQRFDRTGDYAQLRKTWQQANRTLASLGSAELARLQRRLQREYHAVLAIDFFAGEARVESEAEWADLQRRMAQLLSPGEPQQTSGGIARLDTSQHQGRTWATRRRLWVDRAASAWLIRRFIDPEARFVWLAKSADCPEDALGFDVDGATFGHVGERVTFETLMASFGLEADRGLMRLAALVHQIDVGGEPIPEAIGFEAVMAGARSRLPNDDALLGEISATLDSLYAHFESEAAQAKT